MAREFQPEVAILDIGLPDMSGHDLARAFRADPALGKVLLIAQTGWGQASDRAACAAAGFDVHLVKPVSFEQLEAVLRERENGADTLEAAVARTHTGRGNNPRPVAFPL